MDCASPWVFEADEQYCSIYCAYNQAAARNPCSGHLGVAVRLRMRVGAQVALFDWPQQLASNARQVSLLKVPWLLKSGVARVHI